MEKESSPSFISVPTSIIIGSLIVAAAILISSGVVDLKGGGLRGAARGGNVAGVTASTAPTVNPGGEENTGPVTVSVDDDPVLGDKNAPVTLIEFSDYECPFCKRHFTQTHPEIVKNYIDSGKVKLVFRDLPLSFHDPMATTEAIAANCAREQGGDAAYYVMHDMIFEKTTSNGNGLTKDNLYQFAADQGLNAGNFKTCLDSEKYKDEIAKDLTDAQAANANATPSFIIGKSDPSGTFQGSLLVGAQPYSAFQTIIDQMLQ